MPPNDIRPNRANPRVHFPELTLEALADSIDEAGVLVPVTVHEDPDGDPTPYVLIDGERRWRCARDLGLEKIPANILEEPDDLDNLLTMFNIHMVREPWQDMPTARALGKVMELTGIDNVDELHQRTGLSKTKIKQYKHALTLSQEHQEMVETGRVPLNFFTELRKHAINPLRRRRPALYQEIGEENIVEAFVQKRLSGVNTDTVELRRVSPIIQVAYDEAGGMDGESDLDNVIRELVTDPSMSVSDAYENSVELVVEAGKFATQCLQLVKKFDRLMSRIDDEEETERELVVKAVRNLIDELGARID